MKNFKPAECISAERIILLRRQHDHDEDVWRAITECRSFIREYLFWVDSTQDLKDVAKTTDAFSKMWEEDKEWCYNIFNLSDGCLLGCIGVHNISFMCQSAEIGYWLRLSETRHGYMTEAVKALSAELFNKGLHRLEICCDVNNFNSSKVATRAGFSLEGVQKEALYHYTGLHDRAVFVKFSPYPIQGFNR